MPGTNGAAASPSTSFGSPLCKVGGRAETGRRGLECAFGAVCSSSACGPACSRGKAVSDYFGCAFRQCAREILLSWHTTRLNLGKGNPGLRRALADSEGQVDQQIALPRFRSALRISQTPARCKPRDAACRPPLASMTNARSSRSWSPHKCASAPLTLTDGALSSCRPQACPSCLQTESAHPVLKLKVIRKVVVKFVEFSLPCGPWAAHRGMFTSQR